MFDQFQVSFKALFRKLQGWVNEIVLSLPNIVLASLVLVLAVFMSKYLKKIVRKGLIRTTDNQTVIGVLTNIVVSVFMLIALFIVLNILNLSDAVTALLGTAGVIGLAVGLALQDPLTNLFSGVLMSVRDYYKIGDIIETNGYFGKISKITLRSTIMTSPQGETIIIPNKDVIQNPVKNFSLNGKRRIDISCGVAYGDDLDKVKKIALNAIKDSGIANNSLPIEMFYTEFGDSSINFKLRYWKNVTAQKDFLSVQDEGIIVLKKAFDSNDVTIPFPITTLDFGVVGGVRIDDIYAAKALNGSNKKS